jgi:hypothetical protein
LHDLGQYFPASLSLKSGHGDKLSANLPADGRRMAGGPDDIRVDSIRYDRYVTQVAHPGLQILALHFGYGDDLVARMNERGERFAQVKGPDDIQTK